MPFVKLSRQVMLPVTGVPVAVACVALFCVDVQPATEKLDTGTAVK